MHYQGGKARLGRRIANIIEQHRKPNQTYFEPFCGALGVLQYVPGVRMASDINIALINCFKALQTGWLPPIERISKKTFLELKATQDVTDPLTAYAGIIYSYGGAWFTGYVDMPERDDVRKRTLLRKIQSCSNVSFLSSDYASYQPENHIIYCDPPYFNTAGYKIANNSFNHVQFWQVMRNWSKCNTVIISEYVAPPDFDCIAKFEIRGQFAHTIRPIKTERLFKLSE